MRISKFIHLLACSLLLVRFACGCGRNTHAQPETQAPSESKSEGVTFKEGKGLRVAKNTADFIGLKIVDVVEQKVAPPLRFTAKVYRPAANSHNAMASAFVRKLDAEKLQIGQQINIGANGMALSGTVTTLNHDIEKANGQIEVLLEIRDKQNSLAMGAYVEAVVPAGKAETVVAIPASALLKTAEGNFVYTVSGDRLLRAEVKVGEINNDIVDVKDGLYAGDQIVVNPVMTLWMAELQSIRGGKSCCAAD